MFRKLAGALRYHLLFKQAVAAGLRSLNHVDGDDFGGAVRGALIETRGSRYTAEQRTWFDRIERRRASMLADDRMLRYVDFGAGSKRNQRRRGEQRDRHVERTLGHIARASKPADWARLLHSLVRHLAPERCVEMGTCVGISAGYIGAALQLSGRGKLVTIEGAEPIASCAERTIQGLGLEGPVEQRVGPFEDSLPAVLEELRSIDFIFIDGHHERDATLAYYDMVLPYLTARSLVVFDDIAWSSGMKEAWRAVEDHPRTRWTLDLREIGLLRPQA